MDFVDSGTDGPALLFLPGSYSTGAAWKGILRGLSGSYRTITTSLPGYGDTAETRLGDAQDADRLTDHLAALVECIGAPVHLIGHSYGGLAAYLGALTGKIAPLSVVTFEANPVFSHRTAGPFEWRQALEAMRDSFEAAVLAGAPDAPALIIDYWTRPGTFAAMPEAFQDLCRAKAATNLLDWGIAARFRPDVADFARLTMPCTVARGALANPAIRDISDAIVAHAPKARLHVEPGAGHFLITTHPAQCAAVIDAHMTAVTRP